MASKRPAMPKKAAQPLRPSSNTLRVRATRFVFYAGQRIKEGTIFTLKRASDFSKRGAMEWVDPDMADDVEQAKASAVSTKTLARAGASEPRRSEEPEAVSGDAGEPADSNADVLGAE